MANTPSPWSKYIPGLQLAWDATSLKSLQTCAYKYKLEIIDGWRSSGVHVEFGGYFATAVETFRKARLEGKTKQEATRLALRGVIQNTWRADREDMEPGPWGGQYAEEWRCLGEEPYKNKKGNKAKCPYSHKGHWFPAPGPSICGECGSHTHSERRWISNDTTKDRYTLVRLVAWYCEEQPDDADTGGLRPYAFADGTPAVELSFKIPLPIYTEQVDVPRVTVTQTGGTELLSSTREQYILAGHMDNLVTFGEELFIADNKTTKKPLNNMYWAQYKPNTQVQTYDLAGNLLWPDLKIKGVLIEGAQIMVGGARFGTQPFYHNDAERAEYLREVEWWIKQAERHAKEGYWPMNRSACYTCHFKTICKIDPGKREMFLAEKFEKRHWNPLEER